jgi:ATP-dependent Clp protease adapter protein ClpS
MPYRGVMLNADATPASFIVYGLERFFGEDAERALRLMIRRSRPGSGCGAFLREAEAGELTEAALGEGPGRDKGIGSEKD